MAAWLAVRPHASIEADAAMWLAGRGIRDKLTAAMRPVLVKLWTAAYKAGLKGAGEAGGRFEAVSDQILADRIGRMAAEWVQQVVDTRMRRIAAILAKGGSAAELEAAIRAVLANDDDADLITRTEITRAMASASIDAYRAKGIHKVRWITRSANPCPACLANEAAGPRWIGEPFPSGSTAPPEHPNCECALIPAEDE